MQTFVPASANLFFCTSISLFYLPLVAFPLLATANGLLQHFFGSREREREREWWGAVIMVLFDVDQGAMVHLFEQKHIAHTCTCTCACACTCTCTCTCTCIHKRISCCCVNCSGQVVSCGQSCLVFTAVIVHIQYVQQMVSLPHW